MDSTVPPSPNRFVTDLAGYLSKGRSETLNARLQVYEVRTKHQVWVWISNEGLGDKTIEDYCFDAFNAWGVGRKGFDDGVVLFVFPKADRLRMRIQVGYGLEAALPDREAVQILRKIGPELEGGNYDQGIQDGVNAILAKLEAHEADEE